MLEAITLPEKVSIIGTNLTYMYFNENIYTYMQYTFVINQSGSFVAGLPKSQFRHLLANSTHNPQKEMAILPCISTMYFFLRTSHFHADMKLKAISLYSFSVQS